MNALLLRYAKLANLKSKLSQKQRYKLFKFASDHDNYNHFEYFFNDSFITGKASRAVIKRRLRPNYYVANNEKKQLLELKFVKLICSKKSPKVNKYIRHNFDLVVWGFNVHLIKFFINELKIDIKDLSKGYTNLQWVASHLIFDSETYNLKLAYKTFEYLLDCGVDIKQINHVNEDIYVWINQIKKPEIREELIKVINCSVLY